MLGDGPAKLVAATTRGVVFAVDDGAATPKLAAHFAPTVQTVLSAVAALGGGSFVASAGGDGVLAVRDVAARRLVAWAELPRPATAMDAVGATIAVGLDDGSVAFFAWDGAALAPSPPAVPPLRPKKTAPPVAPPPGAADRAGQALTTARSGAAGFLAAAAAGMEDARDGAEPTAAALLRGAADAVRLSPDGRRVAVGHRDGAIAVHGAAPPRRRVAAFGVARARVTHLDWDATSTCLRVVTSTNELLYYDVDAAAARDDAPKPHDFERRVVPVGARAASDKAWPGATCVFGAHAIGAWPAGRARAAAARAVASLHALEGLTEQRWAALGGLRGGGKRLLAVGADVGDLRVLAAPACVQNAPAREASAHGSRCAAVRWLSGFAREGDDVVARLATAGGHDRCLLQWKVVRLDVAKTQDAAASARAKKRWSVAASRVKLIGASKVAAVPRKGGSKMALCFMCGALNPAATFANHRRTCASRWAKARDAAKKRDLPDDDDDPGPLPPDPHAGVDFSRLDLAALEVANDASQEVYFAHALAECEHCKRRFKKPALRKHRRACTAARPFAPPIARRPKDRGPAPAAWL